MAAEDSLKQRYLSVRDRIDAAAAKRGRRGEDIVLIAVTKYASIDQIRELLTLGHVDFGENREQVLIQHAAQAEEFLQRHRDLPTTRHGSTPEAARWHFIGHLQRNKVRRVLPIIRLIHSVDSLRLAEEIQTFAANRLAEPVEVLVQINAADERQKHGVAAAAARHLIEQIDTMYNVRVRGLMCMAPFTDDPETVRPVFERCGELFEEIRKIECATDRFDILSMGMSNDYEVAIECGANVVRVGTAIFGAPKDAPATK